MDFMDVLLTILPFVLTFLVGLALKSPIYQKGKAVLKSVSKALEDDKISAEELNEIIDHFKKVDNG